MHRSSILLLLAPLAGAWAGFAHLAVGGSPQQGSCVLTAHVPVTVPHRYRQRGNRCEGYYAQGVSTGQPGALSFSFGPGRAPIADPLLDSLTIRWRAPQGGTLTVIAQGQPPLYYQMDARQSSGAGVYRWSMALVRVARRDDPRVNLNDFGVQCSIAERGVPRPVLVPCRLGAASTAPQGSTNVVGLLLQERITSATASLKRKNLDGTTDALYVDRAVTGFSGGRGSLRRISLPEMNRPGLYEMQVSFEGPGDPLPLTLSLRYMAAL